MSTTKSEPIAKAPPDIAGDSARVDAVVTKSASVLAAIDTEVKISKEQLAINRKYGEPCCPSHPGLPVNVCMRECGCVWCSACAANLGISETEMCTYGKCSEMPFCAEGSKWAPGNVECALEMNQISESNLVGVHTKKISEFAFKEGMVMINSSIIPTSAVLFDNGAILNCAKTSAGRLIGSFAENADGDINIGDAESNLASGGSYLHALEYIDSNGNSVDTLYRYDDTPNVICNILSEAVEVFDNGGSFFFNVSSGRVWTTSGGLEMKLHMTKNGLGWCRAVAIIPMQHEYARS